MDVWLVISGHFRIMPHSLFSLRSFNKRFVGTVHVFLQRAEEIVYENT